MVPYLFDLRVFATLVFRSIFTPSKIRTKFDAKRIFFLLVFVPFYISLQLTNILCFVLDEMLFSGYRKIEVKTPFFIFGMPRSGTTFMHRMLSKDPQFTAIKTWEMVFAPSITQKLFWGTFGWLDRLIGGPLHWIYLKLENMIASDFNKIHKVGLLETEEDEVLFLTSFTTSYLYFFFPEKRLIDMYVYFDEHLTAKRRQEIMGFRRTLIKKHMYVFGRDKIYMTKNPSDCGKVQAILDEFPDAKLAYLVRTPYECIPSVMNLFANMYKLANSPMDRDHLKEVAYVVTQYWYQYAGSKMESLPKNQGVVVMYSDLVSHPLDTTKRVYSQLGYEISSEFHSSLIQDEARAKKYKSQHQYDASTHGLSVEDISREYASVFTKYHLPMVGDDATPAAMTAGARSAAG